MLTDSTAQRAYSPHPVRPDELLDGRYRVERLAARGGMGDVYRAFDVRLHRTVALKFLARSLSESEELRERFFREARVLARLDHPNIAPVYSLGEHEGRPFMVMRYVEGRTLEGLVASRGRLDLTEALGIAVQVCDALAYLHGQGFAHFDVKPSNVMIDAAGKCYLLDLGLSGVAGDSAAVGGVVYGSLHYMAPELIRDASLADARADQYSLAATLFESLTGDSPFSCPDDNELLDRVLLAEPPRLSERGAFVPESVEQIMARCLRKRPAERFASVTVLRESLATAMRDALSGSEVLDAAAIRAWLVDGEPQRAPC